MLSCLTLWCRFLSTFCNPSVVCGRVLRKMGRWFRPGRNCPMPHLLSNKIPDTALLSLLSTSHCKSSSKDELRDGALQQIFNSMHFQSSCLLLSQTPVFCWQRAPTPMPSPLLVNARDTLVELQISGVLVPAVADSPSP